MAVRSTNASLASDEVLHKVPGIAWRWEDDGRAMVLSHSFIAEGVVLGSGCAQLFHACNGSRTVTQVVRQMSRTSLPFQTVVVASALERMISYGLIARGVGRDIPPIGGAPAKPRSSGGEALDFGVEDHELIGNRLRRRGKILRFRYPLSFEVELTHSCNYSCVDCYRERSRKEQWMSLTDAKQVIDAIVDARALHVYFLGGEVLLHPNIFEILEYSKKKGLIVKLFTNGGSVLTQERIGRLAQIGVDGVIVSLDSLRKRVNSLTRTSQEHEQIISNLQLLVRNKIGTSISVTAHRKNISDLVSIYLFARRHGINGIVVLKLIINPGKGDDNLALKRLQVGYVHERLIVAIVRLLRLVDRHSTKGRVNVSMVSYPYGFCTGKSKGFTISPTGDIRMCPQTTHVLGSVWQDQILPTWNSPQIQQIVDYENYQFPCSVCFKKSRCAGGCRAEAYYCTRDILETIPGCLIGRAYMLAWRVGLKRRVQPTRMVTRNIVWL